MDHILYHPKSEPNKKKNIETKLKNNHPSPLSHQVRTN
jgi:hypothetical protein